MDIDRRIVAGAGAVICAVAIFSAYRWLYDDRAPLIVVAALLLVASQVLLLGRARGALVALLIAAALNRYSIELGGATFKPEHIVAPFTALMLLPDWRRMVSRLDPIALFLLGWLGWSVIPGLLNAPDPANSTRLWAMLMLVAFAYFAASLTISTPGRARTMTRTWMLTGIGIGVWGILAHFVYHVFDYSLGIQVNPVTRDPSIPGTFHEANLFGSTMTMLGLTGISLLALGTRQTRLAWVAAVVGILAVQISFTRTAWIAFVAGLIAITAIRVIYSPRRLPAPAGRGAIVSFASMAVVVVIGTILLWVPFSDQTPAPTQASEAAALPSPTAVPPGVATPTPVPTLPVLVQGTLSPLYRWTPVAGEANIAGRLGSIGNTSDKSVKLRLEFIRRAVKDWKAHPFVGLGIGSFGQTYINSSNERAWLTMFAVRLLHDGGLIGVALFAAALLLLLRQVIDLLRRPRATETERVALAMGVAVGAMFIAFLATEGLQLAWYWGSLGIFAAVVRQAQSQPRVAP